MTGVSERVCCQINLQENFGGGEVYTRFLTKALQKLGWHTRLFVYERAKFWSGLELGDADIIPVATLAEIEAQLGPARQLVITHSVLPPEAAARCASRSVLTGVVHMPLYERFPEGLRHYHLLFGVSRHVIASGQARGLANFHSEPLYGVADLSPRGPALRSGGLYDWDRRKFRDRLLEAVAPLFTSLAPKRSFARKPGITLGIVSRITPIKQFALMFSVIAPVLARFPRLNLEVFGSGGYASVRDLRRAVAPLGERVRFWGQQNDVASIYGQLDYVLSGLPEKEALGLNLIEAQCCDTPVIAVNAPPFTETVLDGETGYLFTDPRQDQGTSLGGLLESLFAGAPRPRPSRAAAHLARFSEPAFAGRVSAALESALAVA